MIVSRRWTSKYRRVGMAVLARGLSTDWLPSRKRHVEKFSLMPLFARSRVDSVPNRTIQRPGTRE